MPLVINTNISTLVERSKTPELGRDGSGLSQLSAGVRGEIRSSYQGDETDLEPIRAEVRSLASRQQAATDGVSVLQVAEGALGSVAQSLERMRDIALTAAKGGISSDRLVEFEREFESLANQINDLATGTEFDGEKLLDGSAGGFLSKIGRGDADGEGIELSLPAVGTGALPVEGPKVSEQSIDRPESAREAIGTVARAIEDIEGLRGDLGVIQEKLFEVINEVATVRENQSASNSRIVDVDAASETVVKTRELIIMHSDEAVSAQSGHLSELAMRLL